MIPELHGFGYSFSKNGIGLVFNYPDVNHKSAGCSKNAAATRHHLADVTWAVPLFRLGIGFMRLVGLHLYKSGRFFERHSLSVPGADTLPN